MDTTSNTQTTTGANKMTTEEIYEALQQIIYTDQAARNMQNGGHFASAIAEAYFRADSKNKDRLVTAFADLFKKFNY